jgi:hypothetical protein
MDALSLTRERVRVWVCAPLPDTRMHWRRRRILTPGDLSRPACTLSPTLSRKLNARGARRSHALNRARGCWRLSTISEQGEGLVVGPRAASRYTNALAQLHSRPEISAKGIVWLGGGWGGSASLLSGAPASVPVPFLRTRVRHPEPARRPALRKENQAPRFPWRLFQV